MPQQEEIDEETKRKIEWVNKLFLMLDATENERRVAAKKLVVELNKGKEKLSDYISFRRIAPLVLSEEDNKAGKAGLLLRKTVDEFIDRFEAELAEYPVEIEELKNSNKEAGQEIDRLSLEKAALIPEKKAFDEIVHEVKSAWFAINGMEIPPEQQEEMVSDEKSTPYEPSPPAYAALKDIFSVPPKNLETWADQKPEWRATLQRIDTEILSDQQKAIALLFSFRMDLKKEGRKYIDVFEPIAEESPALLSEINRAEKLKAEINRIDLEADRLDYDLEEKRKLIQRLKWDSKYLQNSTIAINEQISSHIRDINNKLASESRANSKNVSWYRIQKDENGNWVLSNAVYNLDAKRQKLVVREYVRLSKENGMPIVGISGDENFKTLVWAEAQQAGWIVEGFCPTPEQKVKAGFSSSYQQPYRILLDNDGRFRIWGFHSLDPSHKKEAAEDYLDRCISRNGEVIFINKESDELKLLVWDGAQKQKVRVEDFEPTSAQKEKLGYPASYRQPFKIQDIGGKLQIYGFDSQDKEIKQKAAKEFLARSVKKFGDLLWLNVGNDEFKLLVWAEAQKQGVRIENVEPSSLKRFALGFPLLHQQIYKVREDSKGQIVVYGFAMQNAKNKAKAAFEYVELSKKKYGDMFPADDGEDDFKSYVWAAAQKQGVRIENFELSAIDKVKFGFSPLHQQAYRIRVRQDGAVCVYGFDDQNTEDKKKIAEEYVRLRKENEGDMFAVNGNDDFKSYVWAAAQKQDVRIENFELSAIDKVKFGFSPLYQQPHRIRLRQDGTVLVFGFDEQSSEDKQKIAKEYVDFRKEKEGDMFLLIDGSDALKAFVWAAAQRQGVRIQNFELSSSEKVKFGFSPLYQQPYRIRTQNGMPVVYGFDVQSPENKKKAAKEYLDIRKKNGSEVFFVNDCGEKLKLYVWVEAQRQGLRIEGFEPETAQKVRFGFPPFYHQPYKICQESDGVKIYGFEGLNSEEKNGAVKAFVEKCIQTRGKSFPLNGDPEFMLMAWAEAFRQKAQIENFDPTPDQRKQMGFEPEPDGFVGTVRVLTPNGYCQIDALKKGDVITKWNKAKKEVMQIQKIQSHPPVPVLRVSYMHERDIGTIVLTPNQSLYTKRGWIPAGDVELNDQLWVIFEDKPTWASVTEAKICEKTEPIFSLSAGESTSPSYLVENLMTRNNFTLKGFVQNAASKAIRNTAGMFSAGKKADTPAGP